MAGLGVVVLYVLVTFVVAVPHRSDLGRAIIGDTGDPSLFLWSWRWEAHVIATGEWGQFWRGNYFYPYQYPVAYTEHVISLMPLYVMFEQVTGNSIAALNLVYISLFALAGTTGFWLGHEITRSWPGAIVGGLAFGFSPFKFGQITHYHIAAIFMMPVVFVLFRRLIERPRLATALGLGLSWAIQMLASFYLGVICLVGLAAYGGVRLLQRREAFNLRFIAIAMSGMLLGLLVIMPLTLPYLTVVKNEITQERSIEEIGTYSTHPRYLLKPHQGSFFYSRILNLPVSESSWELQLFVGIGLGVMATAGLLFWRRSTSIQGQDRGEGIESREMHAGCDVDKGELRAEQLSEQDSRINEEASANNARSFNSWRRRLLRSEKASWFMVSVAGLLCSFGPYMGVPGIKRPVPLPYRALMFVPGFKGLRVPGRFAVLFYLGLAVMAAMGAAWLWSKGRPGKVAVAFLSILMLAEFSLALPVSEGLAGTQDGMPSYVAWLRDAPRGPVIEMPIYREGITGAVRQGYRQYISTYDWLPRVNGYSGYFPHGYKEFVEVMRGFPDKASLDALRDRGVRFVLVHFNEYDDPGEDGPGLPNGADLAEAIAATPDLHEVYSAYPAVIYELSQPRPA